MTEKIDHISRLQSALREAVWEGAQYAVENIRLRSVLETIAECSTDPIAKHAASDFLQKNPPRELVEKAQSITKLLEKP